MQTTRNPRRVVAALWLVLGSVAIGAAGCASPVGRSLRDPPASNELGGHSILEIDSAPSGAMITVNGRPIGRAPTTYRMELDTLGDVAIDLDITADFADAPGVNRNALPPTVSHRIERGERAPTVLNFDTEAASMR